MSARAFSPFPYAALSQRWIVACVVMLGSFMVFLDTAIVNVSLPHMAGGLSATIDETTWALTSYLAANAVILPISGWLANFFGRRRLMLASIATFTVASFLCGLAPNLPVLVAFRVIQGMTGGVMMPLSQSIMLESFPPAERGRAMGFWSMGVVIGPILGPLLGGWLTLEYSWRWVFFVNVPVGVVAILLTRIYIWDPPYIRRRSARVDVLGILFLFLGIGAVQLFFDKGQGEDWFDSRLIIAAALVGGIGTIAFIWRALTVDDPLVDLRVFRSRTFAVGSLLGAQLGLLLFGSLVLLPIYLQTLLGYPPLAAGAALAPRGFGSMIAMPVVGLLSERFDPRRLFTLGLLLGSATMWWLSRLTLEVGYWNIFWPQLFQGFALGLLFVPLTTLTMAPIRREEMGNASSIYNVARNLGSSIGIALMATYLSRSQTRLFGVLGAGVVEGDPAFENERLRLLELLRERGLSDLAAAEAARSQIVARVVEQAQLLSFVSAFRLLALVFLAMIPLVWLIRRGSLVDDPEDGAGAAPAVAAAEIP